MATEIEVAPLTEEEVVAEGCLAGGNSASVDGGSSPHDPAHPGRRLAVLLLVFGRDSFAALISALGRTISAALSWAHKRALAPAAAARLVKALVLRALASAPAQGLLRVLAQLVSLRLVVGKGSGDRSAHISTRVALLFGMLR
jgi:hypothetical protein